MIGFQTDDILLQYSNDKPNDVSFDMFELLKDKRPFKVGSVIISSTVSHFFHSNCLMLDKKYNLQHYLLLNNENYTTAIIYDFSTGVYLSALKDVIWQPKTEHAKFWIPAMSSLQISISTLK